MIDSPRASAFPPAAEARAVLDPGFAPHLADYELADLDRLESSVVGLWPDLTIAYTNPYWARFALENGGGDVLSRWGLGAPICTAVSPELRASFTQSLRDISRGGDPLDQRYECSSAQIYRAFTMRVQRLPGAALLIRHTLVIARPHEGGLGRAFAESDYRDANGLISQCSYCRHVRRPATGSWDWIPAFVERSLPYTSHGICPTCVGYYFPQS